MIFRSMFQTDGTARWFLSETVVVVVGVLLALALNDYWIAREERQLELQYLQRLETDMTGDAGYINDFYKDRIALKLKSLNSIAPVIRGHSPLPDDLEEFLIDVSLGAIGGASPNRWVSSGTYNDLVSTGNLRLIADVNLRQEISRYYQWAEALLSRSRGRTTEYAAVVHSVFPSELRAEMTTEDIKAFGIDRAVARVMQPDFQDLLNQEFNFAYFVLRERVGFSDQGVALVEKIQARVEILEDRNW